MQSNDDPPLLYIKVGTEVSAKFKGAFCEAKISRVDKLIKCKVTYKSTNLAATLSYEQIRSSTGEPLALNEYKTGSLVSVVNLNSTKKDTDNSLQLAVLNKVTDQSSYHVIFNDGDEKTVRRSFIRFKGERHYLNSETLDNAPLNNPEHFLQPIKNSDFPNSPVPRLAASKLSPSLTERTNDTKRTSNNTDDESFDESLYEDAVQTPNSSQIKRASKSVEIISESGIKGTLLHHRAVKKVKTVVLSQSEDENSKVNREENTNNNNNNKNTNLDKNLSSNGSSGDAESDDSSSSDDFPSEIKDRFVAQLYNFMDDRGTSMNRVPTINGVDIDLHRIFIIVRRHGGYNKVCKLRAWADVYKRLQNVPNFPNMNSANVLNLKSAYKRYLQPFEDFYKKLGSMGNMCDLVSRHTASSSSRLNDSHRSSQLFKNRYIAGSSNPRRSVVASASKYKDNKEYKLKSTSEKTKVKTREPVNKTSEKLSQKSGSPSSQKTLNLKNLEIDNIDTDLRNPASNENLTIESIVSSPLTSTKSLIIDDQPQQIPNEEISLFSMVRNINENFKKVKKEKQKNDTNKDEAEVGNKMEESKTQKTVAKGSPVLKDVHKTKVDKIIEKNKDNTKRRSSAKEDDEDEPKSKRKATSRLSVSGSEDTENTKKSKQQSRKKSINQNKSISSNNETNDETDDDKESGPGNSNRASIDQNEKIAKTSNITFSDLDIERVVDVKYTYGGKLHNYRAKIIQLNKDDLKVLVHYLGWNSRYDEWIKVNRLLKLLSEDYVCTKRKSKKNNTVNSSKSKDLSIQPDIQPVSSPSQLNEPTTSLHTPKSSPTIQILDFCNPLPTSAPTIKSLAALKKPSEFQRSLSCTSTCSSEQSKEESDVSAASTDSVNLTKTRKSLNKNEESALSNATNMKTRNSDSTGSISSAYSYRNRSTDKVDSDDQQWSKLSTNSDQQASNQLTTSNDNEENIKLNEENIELEIGAKSDDETNVPTLTPLLLSIKEEIIDTETNNTELELAKTELDTSFNSVDHNIKTPTPKSLNNSRKNSLNDSLINSKKLNISFGSRNNSLERNSHERLLSDKVNISVDSPINKGSLNTELEVSFADDNEEPEEIFATANITLVSFDRGEKSHSQKIDKEQLEKETWEKICGLNSSFSKSLDDTKVDTSTNETKISEDILSLQEFVTNTPEKNKDSDNESKKQLESPGSFTLGFKENKNTIVNKENNSIKSNEDDAKKIVNENKTNSSNVELKRTNSNVELKSSLNEENVFALLKSENYTNNSLLNKETYSFNLTGCTLIGKQRIRYIEEQMKLCRESYAKLKIEISAIDRKKKKLKRGYMDKSNNNYVIGNTTSNEESSKHEITISKK